MDLEWTQTNIVLDGFFDILACGKCKKTPERPIRYVTCGHFFCDICTEGATTCFQCHVPIRPNESQPCRTIAQLIEYCRIIKSVVTKIKPNDLKVLAEAIHDFSIRCDGVIPETDSESEDEIIETTLKHQQCMDKRNEDPKILAHPDSENLPCFENKICESHDTQRNNLPESNDIPNEQTVEPETLGFRDRTQTPQNYKRKRFLVKTGGSSIVGSRNEDKHENSTSESFPSFVDPTQIRDVMENIGTEPETAGYVDPTQEHFYANKKKQAPKFVEPTSCLDKNRMDNIDSESIDYVDPTQKNRRVDKIILESKCSKMFDPAPCKKQEASVMDVEVPSVTDSTKTNESFEKNKEIEDSEFFESSGHNAKSQKFSEDPRSKIKLPEGKFHPPENLYIQESDNEVVLAPESIEIERDAGSKIVISESPESNENVRDDGGFITESENNSTGRCSSTKLCNRTEHLAPNRRSIIRKNSDDRVSSDSGGISHGSPEKKMKTISDFCRVSREKRTKSEDGNKLLKKISPGRSRLARNLSQSEAKVKIVEKPGKKNSAIIEHAEVGEPKDKELPQKLRSVENLQTQGQSTILATKSTEKSLKPSSRPDKKTSKNTVPKVLPKNINKRNAKGETPLHVACVKGQTDYVRVLLEAGSNPNTKDNANWTPLQEAVNLGHREICKMLLQAGALPNTPAMDNRTALHDAAANNKIEEARLLLRFNADKNVYDKFGKRPIDYATSKEMRDLLFNKNIQKIIADILDFPIDQSIIIPDAKIVVLPSNLGNKNRKLLIQLATKLKIEVVTSFRSKVTHVVVETNERNITKLTYHVMLAILTGKWILNCQWITIGTDLKDISEIDLELFEVRGAPNPDTPTRARLNEEKQNPRLFNNCFFYFALGPRGTWNYEKFEFTKESLTALVLAGEGKILNREPYPEDVKDYNLTPFHVANKPIHPLHRCSHYIIYMPGRDEPRVKYNMPHIKSLPVGWFFECIEKFALIDPVLMGIS